MKKFMLAVLLICFAFITGGCETMKGAAEGARKDWNSAKHIDDWMRENMW